MTSRLSQMQTQSAAPKAAVLYVRVSSKQQLIRGDGLASQEATCRAYAEHMGYTVLEVFRDNVTGGVEDRPAMNAMLRFLRKHKAAGLVVIVDHPNRFSRDVHGHWDLRHLLKAAGGRLESPNMKFGDSPAEILLENVTMSASQYQREQNAEQTRDRMRGRLLNGFWPFIPPRAMKHQRVPGLGNVLVRVEPEATVIAEGLEAFASGRLQTQAEFARYLNDHPAFGKGRRKRITNQQAHDLLTTFLYGGVVEKPEWGISRIKGKHQGLVSYETYEKVEARLRGGARAPIRSDVNEDFPLRGGVACAHCGKPLTACWSTSKTGVKHPYYMCYNGQCDRNRKSIRRDEIESRFVALLEELTPKPTLIKVAGAMFRHAWNQRLEQSAVFARANQREIEKIDRQIAVMLDRIVEASSATVIGAFEKRIDELERNKLVLQERSANAAKSQGNFDELFELALNFLTSPSKLWRFGTLEHRKTVLRLVFSEPPAYAPDEGFRTPKTTMPFSMLGTIEHRLGGMAEREGFEPPVELPPRRISSAVQSTTLPPLREIGPLAAAGRNGPAYGIANRRPQQDLTARLDQN